MSERDVDGLTEAGGSEPPEIGLLKEALFRLPGVEEVEVGFMSLVGFDPDNLRFAPMADLPAATIRRTRGGLPGESLIQVSIRAAKDGQSWNTLEFLGWYVSDAARAGTVAQMRLRGLPPQVGDNVQIGETLRFLLEWFVVHPDGEMNGLLKLVAEEANALGSAITMHGHLLRRRQ